MTCRTPLPRGPSGLCQPIRAEGHICSCPQNWNRFNPAGNSRGETGKLCYTKMATVIYIPSRRLVWMCCHSPMERQRSRLPLIELCSISSVTAKRGQLCDFGACIIKGCPAWLPLCNLPLQTRDHVVRKPRPFREATGS